MPFKDYYQILFVQDSAPVEVIQASYRSLMKLYHPDKNPDAINMAKEMNEAYEVLMDEQKRKKFHEEWAAHQKSSSFYQEEGGKKISKWQKELMVWQENLERKEQELLRRESMLTIREKQMEAKSHEFHSTNKESYAKRTEEIEKVFFSEYETDIEKSFVLLQEYPLTEQRQILLNWLTYSRLPVMQAYFLLKYIFQQNQIDLVKECLEHIGKFKDLWNAYILYALRLSSQEALPFIISNLSLFKTKRVPPLLLTNTQHYLNRVFTPQEQKAYLSKEQRSILLSRSSWLFWKKTKPHE